MNIKVEYITVGPFRENSFIIWDQDTSCGILIDPGDEPEIIISKIKMLKIRPLAIFCTHAHLDHIGAISKIKEEYKIPFYLNNKEKIILDHYPEMCRMFNVTKNETPRVNHWLEGDGIVQLNDINIQYFETPGHTPGGTSFIIGKICFCGDTLFAGAIGRTDFPGGDYSTLIESIVKIKNRIGSNWLIYPGHGPATTMIQELDNNPFLSIIK